MRLLLDTQCWLWMSAAPDRFVPDVRAVIAASGTELWLSAASAWEITIKHALGKLTLPVGPTEYVQRRLQRTKTRALTITHVQALRTGELPRLHGDPFDRLLVAQAQLEGLRLVSADPQMRRYDVDVFDASS